MLATFLLLVMVYGLAALLLSYLGLGSVDQEADGQVLCLTSNGVHLNIVLPSDVLPPALREGLSLEEGHSHCSFGWGDERFYLRTPTWFDLRPGTACTALFWPSSTLMHVHRLRAAPRDAACIRVSDEQMEGIVKGIENGFALDENGSLMLLEGAGYTMGDDFYRARGSYHLFYTCNTWVNDVLKSAGLPASLWTPFDFALMQHYRRVGG